MKVAFGWLNIEISKWLWSALSGEPPAASLPVGSRERHDALVRRRAGMTLLDTIKPKDLATVFAPHTLLGFWDHEKHEWDAPLKPSNAKKDRKDGLYIIEVDDDIYASLSPQPELLSKYGESGKALDDVGEGTLSHIEQLFDRQTAASSVAAQRLADALDVMYGRAPIPDKVRAKANKKLLKVVSGLTSESTELRIWDRGFEATPDLSGFPNTTVLGISHNPMTVLDGLSAVPKLEKLDISDCPVLVAISDEIGQLTELRELNLSMCHNLQTLPESLRGHPKLELLLLDNCPVALDIEMLASFPSLKEVRLPTGFSEGQGARLSVAPESTAAMVEIADRLRAMRPDMSVLQFGKGAVHYRNSSEYTLHLGRV